MKKIVFAILFVLQSTVLFAQDTNNAYILKPTIWQSNTISVCWDNPSDDNAEMRRVVQQAVKDTWEKNCGIQFTDWVPASEKDCDIHILIEDNPDDGSHNNGPHTKGLGNTLLHKPQGMVLNFTFDNWCQACKDNQVFSIKAIAVHEFGHALGFAHEQNRRDCNFPNCFGREQGGDGDWYLSSCDQYSIMNYCNRAWNNNGSLSPLDIKAAQYLYGLPGNQSPQLAPLQFVHTSNSIAPVRGQRINHEFKIYIVGNDASLSQVTKVVYHLTTDFNRKHPDFTVNKGVENFGLGLRVWGEFPTSADLYMEDGSVKTLTRYLDFASLGVEPKEPSSQPLPMKVEPKSAPKAVNKKSR